MIRKATFHDLEQIEDMYNEHFQQEIECGAFIFYNAKEIDLGMIIRKVI